MAFQPPIRNIPGILDILRSRTEPAVQPPLRRLEQFRSPCVTICAIMVNGANADVERFRRDLTRTRAVFRQCGVRIREGTFTAIDDATLLDHPDWNCGGTVPETTNRLLSMTCSPGIIAFYVRSIGGSLVGCGGSGTANGRPGFVVTDSASRNTFAHELGHVFLGGAHSTDKTNVMFSPSGSITSDPPKLTEAQCRTVNANSGIEQCFIFVRDELLQRAAEPSAFTTVAVPPLSPLLELLLSDEGEGFAQLAAMGQAVVPELVMLLSRSTDPNVRARAAHVLGLIGGMNAVGALPGAVRADPNPVVRLVAANALTRAACPAAEQTLLTAVQDADPGVRTTVLRSLTSLRTPTALMAATQLARMDPNLQVRSLAGRLAQGM